MMLSYVVVEFIDEENCGTSGLMVSLFLTASMRAKCVRFLNGYRRVGFLTSKLKCVPVVDCETIHVELLANVEAPSISQLQ